eukprot:scaffold5540_cov390-Prasinococcus_capsulatus_cf.AAC.14
MPSLPVMMMRFASCIAFWHRYASSELPSMISNSWRRVVNTAICTPPQAQGVSQIVASRRTWWQYLLLQNDQGDEKAPAVIAIGSAGHEREALAGATLARGALCCLLLLVKFVPKAVAVVIVLRRLVARTVPLLHLLVALAHVAGEEGLRHVIEETRLDHQTPRHRAAGKGHLLSRVAATSLRGPLGGWEPERAKPRAPKQRPGRATRRHAGGAWGAARVCVFGRRVKLRRCAADGASAFPIKYSSAWPSPGPPPPPPPDEPRSVPGAPSPAPRAPSPNHLPLPPPGRIRPPVDLVGQHLVRCCTAQGQTGAAQALPYVDRRAVVVAGDKALTRLGAVVTAAAVAAVVGLCQLTDYSSSTLFPRGSIASHRVASRSSSALAVVRVVCLRVRVRRRPHQGSHAHWLCWCAPVQ